MDGASSDQTAGIGPGAFVGVVGPSGAGKDSVLAATRVILPADAAVIFAQRVVTRMPDATEQSAPVSQNDFDVLRRSGAFALEWSAHGVSYAVPASVDNDIYRGSTVVANVSRTIAHDLRRRYARGVIVLVDAPAAVRRMRLGARGREQLQDIEHRLDRDVASFRAADADLVIDNSGTIDAAARAFAAFLAGLSASHVRARSA